MSNQKSPSGIYIDGSNEPNDINQGRRKPNIPEEKPIRSGLYYVIPSQVFEDERLEHSETMFYALLSGIAWNDGFCHASNDYLAKRMRVDDRTIRKWLERLEDFGYVHRETIKHGMYWERKIFITHSSKKHYEGTSRAGSKGTVGPDGGASQGHIVSEDRVSEESVCNGPPVGVHDEKKMKKIHVDGHEIEVSLQDIFKEAVIKKKNWTTQEIHDAWIILGEYDGKIRDPLAFFDGTIRNLRNQKKAEHLQKQGKLCKNSEIATYADSSERLSVEDMKAQPSLGSLLEGVKMKIIN